ncbi:MAG: hypothetical protein GY940_07820 [bacterium]|nr:hypothetical protein [bacterium]
MASRTYADRISDAEVMLAGLIAKLALVSTRGMNQEFIDNFKLVQGDAVKLNNQQEDLKSQLNAKTDELEAKMKELQKLYSESSKVVKLAVPQNKWKSFGINATR